MRMTTSRRWALTLFGTAAFLIGMGVCSGCGAREDHGVRDAPINTDLQANLAPFIVNGPDRFHNLALMCVADDLTVTHTREAAPVVVSHSSACDPGVAEALGIPRVKGLVPTSTTSAR